MSETKILMTDSGANRAAVVQALIQSNGWNFMQALQFVDSLPGELTLGEEQIEQLRAAGAVIEEVKAAVTEPVRAGRDNTIRINSGNADITVAGKIVLRDAYILMADSVTGIQDLMPVLEHVIKEKASIVVLAKEISQLVVDTLKINRDKGVLDSVCVRLYSDDDSELQTLNNIKAAYGGQIIYKKYGMEIADIGAVALAKAGYVEVDRNRTVIAASAPATEVTETPAPQDKVEKTDRVFDTIVKDMPAQSTVIPEENVQEEMDGIDLSWNGWRDMPVGHRKIVIALTEFIKRANDCTENLRQTREDWVKTKENSQKIYETATDRIRKKYEEDKLRISKECDENVLGSDSTLKKINAVAAACGDFVQSMPKNGDVRKAVTKSMQNVEKSLVTVNKTVSDRTALYRQLRDVQTAEAERERNDQLDRARSDQIERDNQSDKKYNSLTHQLEEEFSSDIKTGFSKNMLKAYRREVMSSRFNPSAYECPTEIPDYIMLGDISAVISDSDQQEKTVIQAASTQTEEVGARGNGEYVVTLPYAQSLRDGISLLMRYHPNDRTYAQSLIQPLLLKLFMSFPAGKLEATMIDPLELGASFSYIPKLAEAPESSRIIDTKIWSKEKDIEAAIATLRQRLENMTQAYGGDRESRLKKEVIRALAIADFPVGFNETALKDLNAIVRNSASLGVCVFICANEEELEILKQKNASIVNEISQSLIDTRVDGKRLMLTQSNEGLYIELDEMKDALDNKDEILRTISTSIEHTQLKIEHFANMYREDIYDSNNWFTGNHDEIAIPLGIKGADTIVKMVLGRGKGSTEHHALIAGQTGAGKSTLLHTLIMSTLISYSPDEVQMYLLDFKEGVEFSAYTRYRLPSLRVVAINSEREFGLTVLKELCTELETRTKHFTRYGVSDINSYVQLDDAPKIPKLLLIFDEVQELFRNKNESDNISDECLSCINKLVMQGRAMGIHLILACQDFHNCSGLEAYFSQMAIRIAVKGSEEGAASILNSDNSGIRTLQNQPAGAAIYNGGGGVESANNFFQVSYINEEERLNLLSHLDAYFSDPLVGQMYEDYETRILLTNAEDNVHNCFNRLILQGLDSVAPLASSTDGYGLLLGQGFGKKSEFIPELRAADRENLLVVSRDERIALSLFELASMSVLYDELNTASDKSNALIYVVNLMAEELNSDECDFDFLCSNFSRQIAVEGLAGMEDMIDSVYQLILGRSEGRYTTSERIFFMFFGINRARKLRSGGLYGNDSPEELTPLEKLKQILINGPRYGVNCFVWGESIHGIETMLGDRYESLFNKRIAYGLDPTSMDILVAETDANTMHGRTAVYMDTGRDIKNTHFRPYDIPAKVWIERYAEVYEELIGEGGYYND